MPSLLGRSIHNHFLKHPIVSTNMDGHLKWLPQAFILTAKIFGVPMRSNWKKQVLIIAATEAIRYLAVDSLKKITGEQRPAPFTGHHSFPSGHTASAFAGAEFMRRELRQEFPVLGCIGYIGATATAVIRLGKSRHWLNDVVCGAAVGVLATSLAYLIFSKKPGKQQKEKDTSQTDDLPTQNALDYLDAI
jgi:hypothetical protein